MKLQKAEIKWYRMSRCNFGFISSYLSKCFPLQQQQWDIEIFALAAGKRYHFSMVVLLESLFWVRKCLLVLPVFDGNALLLLLCGQVCLY